ncbi:glutamine-hydrolyzing carbamoyl-phosphate synthase small subunit [Bifidobacterium aquikefiri]|uniref:glutamine-hydrolyzing carbamoyl-phosphate synthase small subunit n=1 Tax=Bifidobacterium aquikefiri TaxID=1653207 RepID=UPI0039E78CB5
MVNLYDSDATTVESFSPDDAILVLEDGQVYVGKPFGALGQTTAEIVFTTGMTGYQETITDPSYDRQILIQTFPHIGNTGVNGEDNESSKIWVAGYVVREPSPNVSNWRATGSLQDDLISQGIVGISGIDTRKLVRHLRSAGVMRAGIFSGNALKQGNGELASTGTLRTIVEETPQMAGAHLMDEVSTAQEKIIAPRGAFAGKKPLFKVAALDFGIKSMTPQRLSERGCEVHILPQHTTFEELQALSPDGVFFSNGPGDPATAHNEVALLREVLDRGYPFFGICLGNQLLGRALGFGTYKLKFGHRGINQPVKDVNTDKVSITSQNHGFAVDAPLGTDISSPFDNGHFGKVKVSHIGLNDDVVEGLQCLDIPAFSVQYHPEASAGPHDATYLFDRFINLMKSSQDSQHAQEQEETEGKINA